MIRQIRLLILIIIAAGFSAGAQGQTSRGGGESLIYDSSTGELRYKNYVYKMIPVAGGSFMMGATAEQGGEAYGDEKPVRQLTLSDFNVGQTEVPQWLWEAVMGNNPSKFQGAKLPVEQVSWDDCQEFLRKLNSMTGQRFKLPTEAQWEYVARGGSRGKGYKYSGSDRLEDVAWYENNSGDKTHEVATKLPNELGLYDMSGNVYEWCQDWYGSYSTLSDTNPTGPSSGTHRVLRGGAWGDGSARSCRVSNRVINTSDRRYDYLGFRLVLNKEEGESVADKNLDSNSLSYDAATGELRYKNYVYKMIPVSGGTFSMGATSEQDGDVYLDEKPVHRVTLSDFSIGQTEVPQWLWEAVMGNNPSNFKGAKLPVEKVSWDDCQEFLKKLNTITGQRFRLPTEAQWEYAARGGSRSKGYKYSGSNRLEDVAWYEVNSGDKTHEIGTKLPNELGLYDMSGNVWEWCQNWFETYSSSPERNPTGPSSGSYRMDRGGGWSSSASLCRVSLRNSYASDHRSNNLGFRLAR